MPNQTQPITPDVRPAGVYPVAVGDFRCLVLSDEVGYSLPASLITNATREEVAAALRSHALPADQVPMQISVLYIHAGQHRILIDTGLGQLPGPNGKVDFVGKVRSNLQAFGIAPEAIDTVILSHAHSDHYGGIFDEEGGFSFPNAHYVLPKAEWTFWMEQPDLSSLALPEPLKQRTVQSAQSCLARLQPRLRLIEEDEVIYPGVAAVPAKGETPGHSAFLVSSNGDSLLVVGDAWPHYRLTAEHPEWLTAFDLDPEQTVRTRRALLDRAAEENLLVLAYHFPWPSLGRIVKRGASWSWEATEYRW
ncbi:MBL fold metallo-hydrolase [Cohnella zeiphila]|uniref:MBL fold metallo-hydrolase n=1 Tax=Cohnella zeiphila TaxID=2761120 RepID=A0A7X0VX31_9BACL|nr:MBL fold metallo-hydrolase [Cohnella zeiphila]MBB6731513.1 MBL fold metallo-hydrolase [Cohnella zeiphila]